MMTLRLGPGQVDGVAQGALTAGARIAQAGYGDRDRGTARRRHRRDQDSGQHCEQAATIQASQPSR